jgi:hypothetical protein
MDGGGQILKFCSYAKIQDHLLSQFGAESVPEWNGSLSYFTVRPG